MNLCIDHHRLVSENESLRAKNLFLEGEALTALRRGRGKGGGGDSHVINQAANSTIRNTEDMDMDKATEPPSIYRSDINNNSSCSSSSIYNSNKNGIGIGKGSASSPLLTRREGRTLDPHGSIPFTKLISELRHAIAEKDTFRQVSRLPGWKEYEMEGKGWKRK